MIKVSIIVPVYNVEEYLKECLESIINQTLKEIEIICINDGSTDNSLNILENYAQKDSRITIINKKNEGQSIARDIGVEKATGEYLGFVDSDDWIDLNYFEEMYNSVKKFDCDMACAGFKRCKKNKKRISKCYEAELLCTNVNDKIRMDNLPCHNYIWNKIFRRKKWLELGIKFQAGRYYEDMALIIKIIHKMDKMVTVPNVYYNYRVNPNSIVAQKSIKHTKDYNWAKNELINYAEKNDIQLNVGDIVQKKEYYKFFNFTVLKVYHYEYKKQYNLLGIIPILTKYIV